MIPLFIFWIVVSGGTSSAQEKVPCEFPGSERAVSLPGLPSDFFLQGKTKKWGRFFEEGDKAALEISLFPAIQGFFMKKSDISGHPLPSHSFPKMMAFGEDHTAGAGLRKRGKILGLIFWEACLKGIPLTLMDESFNGAAFEKYNSDPASKKQYLQSVLSPKMVDDLPLSCLENIKLTTWEGELSNTGKSELLTFLLNIQEETSQMMSRLKTVLAEGATPPEDKEISGHHLLELQKLTPAYEKIAADIDNFWKRLRVFIRENAQTRNEELVFNALREMENHPERSLILIAGSSHLVHNPYAKKLWEKEGTSLVMLHSYREKGELKKDTSGLWESIKEIALHLAQFRQELAAHATFKKWLSQLPFLPAHFYPQP